ncbi:MAG: STAS domain-containing protein [Pseudomonadales bacterium]|nr:STAS domain-containing protein [Pseudomonadales bacterium]
MKLDSDLSIKNVELLYSTFEGEYEKGDNISLDASGVDRIDTTAFQVIAALKTKLESENLQLTITEASDEFINSAKLLGLAGALDLASNPN